MTIIKRKGDEMMNDNEYIVEAEGKEYIIRETAPYMVNGAGMYTIDDYLKLPDDVRVELIDGYFYAMAAPRGIHQMIAGEIYRQIANFILDKDGRCIPYISPVDVRLDRDNKTMLQPDVFILCRKDKSRFERIEGAPDFVLEIISPSTLQIDYNIKLKKYKNAGVREYWILDPYKERLMIYDFKNSENPVICGLDEAQGINIYNKDLVIDFHNINHWIKEYNSEKI